jgi:hypothetical protein
MKRFFINFTITLTPIVLIISQNAFATIHLSDLPISEITNERIKAKMHHASPTKNTELGGFDELVPYVLPSPNQEDAGSCLYMAITGIAEWWLARLNPTIPRTSDGLLDLSERYTMNLANAMEEDDVDLANWRTDTIYLFNQNNSHAVRNITYRFTKGWYYGETYSDHLEPATKNTPNAAYGTLFNWIDQRPVQQSEFVQLPQFERKIIFADPEKNQWNIGVAPDNIVEQVKHTLQTEKAPILVIYNHNSWWHAVYVIGYNDNIENGNCAYTENFRKRIDERAQELDQAVQNATDPVVKKAYEIRAKRAHEAKSKIETAYATRGGCTNNKGVFYIRDSIYPDPDGEIYHYDPENPDADDKYTKKIVFKEYDWLRYFANHISVIYPAR